MTSALKIQALSSWLTSGAPPQDDYDKTVAELARRLVDAGLEAPAGWRDTADNRINSEGARKRRFAESN